jgi:hypothetical protein
MNACTQRSDVVAAARAAGALQLQPATLAQLTQLLERASAHSVVRYAQLWWLVAAPEHAVKSPFLVSAGLPCAPAPAGALLSFRQLCERTPLLAGQGLPGLALARGIAGWVGEGDAFELQAYPLRHAAQAAGLFTGCAISLRVAGAAGGPEATVVLECLCGLQPADDDTRAALMQSLGALLDELAAAAAPPPPAAAPPVEEEEEEESDSDSEPVAGAKHSVTLEELTACFAYRLKEAATRLGMCTTTLKRICRTHRVARWPSRKKWRLELEPALRSDGPAGVARIMVSAAPQAPRVAAAAPAATPAAAAPALFCYACGVPLFNAAASFCHCCGTKAWSPADV